MSDENELIARHAAERGPSEWQAALERFRGGYGHSPDFNDPIDRVAYLQLLRDAVRRAMDADMVAMIQHHTERLKEAFSEIHNDGEGTP